MSKEVTADEASVFVVDRVWIDREEVVLKTSREGRIMVVFMIVGKSEPLYEAELGSSGKDELAYLYQFILHSSLDMVDNAMWANQAT